MDSVPMDTCMPTVPGGSLEVVISFDTTGSMYGYLEEIRGRVQDMIQRLQADIPGIRMAVLAHGDYCDAHNYVTKWEDLTNDIAKLCDFVKNVDRTGGGDAPECYELVMRQVRTKLSWAPSSKKVLILIGDNNPHNPFDTCNVENIDWKEEAKLFAEMGISIYGVQCGDYCDAEKFYKTISIATQGKHLRLAQFSSLFDTLMAVCYREGDVDAALLSGYEKEVRARCHPGGKIAPDIDAIFASLRDDATDKVTPTTPTPPTSPATVLSPTKPPTVNKGVRAAQNATAIKPKPVSKTATKFRSVPKKKKQNSSGKFLAKNLPLLKRENVPENNFSLRCLKWSPWILALADVKDIPQSKKNLYVKRVSRPGYRLHKLPIPKISNGKQMSTVAIPALFEVAVQGPALHAKRHVAFSSFSQRCLGLPRWDNRLLRSVNQQVDRLLNAGGRIFVRYSVVQNVTIKSTTTKNVPKSDRVSSLMEMKFRLQRYDYAWKKVRNIRTGSRFVQKGDLVVSA